MKPDFQAMSKAELKAYILEHREDTEAFYAYMDILANAPVLATHSLSDTEPLSDVIERVYNKKMKN